MATLRWTIGQRIGMGFSLLIAISAVLGTSAYLLVGRINVSAQSMSARRMPGIVLMGKVESQIKQNFINTTQHYLAKTGAEKQEIEKQMEVMSAQLTGLYKEYESLLVTEEEKAAYEEIKRKRVAYRDARSRMLQLSREGKSDAADEFLQKGLYGLFQDYTAALSRAAEADRAEADRAAGLIASRVQQTRAVTLIAVTAAVVAGIGGAWIIARRTARRLAGVARSAGEAARQLTASSQEISSASQSLAQGASELAASIEETSASLEEISSMTKRNADHAKSAKAAANEARQRAETGASKMKAMITAMDAIQGSSDNIAKIVKTIDEIAFQTNLLALNAAVEAARAGEAGAGFAVVADEVRSLAQRSATAARETSERIEDSITKSRHGVGLSGEVSAVLGEIVAKVASVDDFVAEIASASAEQQQGIEQVLTAVTQMEKGTQVTASAAEQCSAAAQEMQAQAFSLDHVVGDVEALAGTRHRQPLEGGEASDDRSSDRALAA